MLQGASADVFAAADWRQMEQVNEGGLLGNTPVYFVANRMTVVTPVDFGKVRSLADLADPGVTVALAAEGGAGRDLRPAGAGCHGRR